MSKVIQFPGPREGTVGFDLEKPQFVRDPITGHHDVVFQGCVVLHDVEAEREKIRHLAIGKALAEAMEKDGHTADTINKMLAKVVGGP